VNLNQPTFLDCLSDKIVIDVACGENFTVAIVNPFDKNLISGKSIQTFKTTHFSNIKEKIKNYRSYSQSLQNIGFKSNFSRTPGVPPRNKQRCITKIIGSPSSTERPRINSFAVASATKRNLSNMNENTLLKEEALKY